MSTIEFLFMVCEPHDNKTTVSIQTYEGTTKGGEPVTLTGAAFESRERLAYLICERVYFVRECKIDERGFDIHEARRRMEGKARLQRVGSGRWALLTVSAVLLLSAEKSWMEPLWSFLVDKLSK